MEAPPRQVTVYDLCVLSYDRPEGAAGPDLHLTVECGPGTYIRALARDLGEQLGCGAHLRHLVRTASGRFCLDEALSLAEIEAGVRAGALECLLRPLDDALLDYAAVVLDPPSVLRVVHGGEVSGFATHEEARQTLRAPGPFPDDSVNGEGGRLVRAYDQDGKLLAVLQSSGEGVWRPAKVLVDARAFPNPRTVQLDCSCPCTPSPSFARSQGARSQEEREPEG
ncbi:MAG: hypothetical protein HYY04_04165 [Chloroflexi bacterium]|nr:hypothetical protein [Chloroflexota bacterium]